MIHLRGEHTDVVIDVLFGVPVIAYWGSPLGPVDPASVVAALERPLVQGTIGVVAPISVVPEHGSGFQGRPGLTGSRRGGVAWSPRFSPSEVTLIDCGVVVAARDAAAELLLTTRITLADVLTVSCTLTNEGAGRYLLDGLHLTLPLPAHASDLMTFDGRWTREFHPVRRPWGSGSWLSENRSGRTSHENAPLVFAGAPGFGEWHGEVWGVHVAWSGNHTMLADCLPDGRRYVQGGELLHPGEVCLEAGESYSSPSVVGTFSSSD